MLLSACSPDASMTRAHACPFGPSFVLSATMRPPASYAPLSSASSCGPRALLAEKRTDRLRCIVPMPERMSMAPAKSSCAPMKTAGAVQLARACALALHSASQSPLTGQLGALRSPSHLGALSGTEQAPSHGPSHAPDAPFIGWHAPAHRPRHTPLQMPTHVPRHRPPPFCARPSHMPVQSPRHGPWHAPSHCPSQSAGAVAVPSQVPVHFPLHAPEVRGPSQRWEMGFSWQAESLEHAF